MVQKETSSHGDREKLVAQDIGQIYNTRQALQIFRKGKKPIKKKFFAVIPIIALLLYITFMGLTMDEERNKKLTSKELISESELDINNNERETTIATPERMACKIPQVDPWDDAIKPFVDRPSPFSCGPPPPLTHLVPCPSPSSSSALEQSPPPAPSPPAPSTRTTSERSPQVPSTARPPPASTGGGGLTSAEAGEGGGADSGGAPPPLHCSLPPHLPPSFAPPPLVRINASLIGAWTNASSLGELECCAAQVTRGQPRSETDLGADNRFRIGECHFFNDTISITSDFTMVNCTKEGDSVYVGMHAHVVPTEDTLRKVRAAAGRPLPPSVFLLAVDSSSRLNFLRAMPKVRAVLEKAGAVDMNSYNKVGENTLPNLMPLFGGLSEEDANGNPNSTTRPTGYGCWPGSKYTFDECPLLFKNFSRAGYVTAFTEDEPTTGTFNYYKPGFRYPPVDHYIRPYFVFGGEHTMTVERKYAYWCYAQRPTHHLMMEYVKSFVHTYSSKVPYFSFLFFVGLGHALASDIELADEDVAEFLSGIIASADADLERGGGGLFLAVFSDHGMRWGRLRQSPMGWMEERIPFLYIRPPIPRSAIHPVDPDSRPGSTQRPATDFPLIVKSLYPSLLINKDRLITPYDFHFTLAALLQENRVAMNSTCAKCYDLLREVVPASRTCEEAKIPEKYCTCVDELRASIDTPRVVNTALKAVKYLNDILEGLPQCAPLTLNEILTASYRTIPAVEEKNQIRMLGVNMVTFPGKGIFEVDTIIDKNDTKIQPFPTRLNSYGNQSWCIDDWKLKPYCFCL